MMDFEDFSKIYENNQETSMEFKEIIEEGSPSASASVDSSSEVTKIDSMIRAIKTFDHQNSGFISINELKFSIFLHSLYILNLIVFVFVLCLFSFNRFGR